MNLYLLFFSLLVGSKVEARHVKQAMVLDNGGLPQHSSVERTGRQIRSSARDDVCTSEVCKQTAQRMLEAMDPTVDPCDNFYQYACGNWMASHPVPRDRAGIDTFSQLDDAANQAVQKLLSDRQTSILKSEIKAKAMYKQCINEEERKSLGVKPVLDLLRGLIGGWPLITPNWNATAFNYEEVLRKLQNLEENPFSVLELSTYKSLGFTLSLDSQFASLASGALRHEVIFRNFMDGQIKFASETAALFLLDTGDRRSVNDSLIAAELTNLMEVTRYMATFQIKYLPRAGELSLHQHKLVKGMESLFEAVISSSQLPSENPTKPSFSLAETAERTRKLKELGESGRRRAANYIGWIIIMTKLPLLSREYRDAFDDYSIRVSIDQKRYLHRSPLEERCASEVTAALPLAVGAMYVRKFYPADPRPKITELVENVKSGFRDLLARARLNWMDQDTYTNAVARLLGLTISAPYPNILADGAGAIEDEYGNVVIEGDYFTTAKNAKNQLALDKRQGTRRHRNYHDITDANGFFYGVANQIVVTAAFMNTPVYESDNLNYLNYGALGMVIGHEVTHGFHAEQDLNRVKIDNLIGQYNNFQDATGSSGNGARTLDENIADIGGLRAAYKGYFTHYAKEATVPEPLLPGFNSTSVQQLFFLSTAQMWCSSIDPRFARVRLLTDPHSPPEFRVLGMMTNLQEFAQAYQCPLGSRMNTAIKNSVY